MVILRSSGGVSAQPAAATPKRRLMELDTTAEFLSLIPASQRKSARLARSSRTMDDSFSSPDNNKANVRKRTDTDDRVRESVY